MEIYSHPDIAEIILENGNSNCFDCGSSKPKWSSVNNGIFICLKCASIHRNLGSNISVVKSLESEEWNDKQVLFLKKGGNDNLKNFFNEYNIQEAFPIEVKFKTKASEYYRNNLRNIVEKELNPEFKGEELIKPNEKIGNEFINENKNKDENYNKDLMAKENNEEVIDENQDFFDMMGNFFFKTKKKILETSKNVGKKLEEAKIMDKIKNTGSNAVDFIQKGGNLIVQKTQEAYNSEIVQDIKKKTGEGINIITDKAKNILNIKDESNNNNNGNNNKESELKSNDGINENVINEKKDDEVKNDINIEEENLG